MQFATGMHGFDVACFPLIYETFWAPISSFFPHISCLESQFLIPSYGQAWMMSNVSVLYLSSTSTSKHQRESRENIFRKVTPALFPDFLSQTFSPVGVCCFRNEECCVISACNFSSSYSVDFCSDTWGKRTGSMYWTRAKKCQICSFCDGT